MPKPQRYCIYCGGTGMSKEHMWPAWLRPHVPRTMSNFETKFVAIRRDGDHSEIRRKTGDPHSTRLRVVCQACNSGWMSRLQEETKPILVPMIEGDQVHLYRKSQLQVARWVSAFVMTGEYLKPREVATTQSERDYVRTRTRAPANWRIWLGRYEGQQWPRMWEHRSFPVAGTKHVVESREDGSRIPNTQTTTFRVGRVYVTVLSSAVTSIVRSWYFGERGGAVLRQIWPIVVPVIDWPTPALTDADAADFASAFRRAGRLDR